MFTVRNNLSALLILLIIGCDNHQNKIESKQLRTDTIFKKDISTASLKKDIDTTNREFDSFFNKFNSNRDFQLSRIKFPLKVKANEDDGQNIKMMKESEWTYTNFTKVKNIHIEKKTVARDEMDLKLFIIDTGVQVEYHFNFLNNQWWLIGITDRSD